jgi:hypothetical protein
MTLERHHHEQIDVRVVGRCATRVRAEQDDALGMHFPGDLVSEVCDAV